MEMPGNIILPNAKELQYCGRIDLTNKLEPVFIYSCSFVTFKFTGTSIRATISNMHCYYDNYIGYIIDGKQGSVKLSQEQEKECILLEESLEDKEHEIIVFKRMDACHYFKLLGFILDEGAVISSASSLPTRRIEVYGDSVSAGEVSEAIDYVGMVDPQHNGEYSNSWYSYAWIAARKLGAQIHNISQGGIALIDGTGWFDAPHYYGMEHTWDKLRYQPELGPRTAWDFKEYIPHVVVVAIGQNDNNPVDYMKENYQGEKASGWRIRYANWIKRIRETYPYALIILSTTILNHHANWDRAIDEVCLKLNDKKIVHFLYKKNGNGTPGHIRISEAEEMADELSAFIQSFGDEIWEVNDIRRIR